MRKMSRKILSLAVLVVSCFNLYAQAQLTAIERPMYATGDTWTYRTLDGWSGAEQSRTMSTFKRQSGERLEFVSVALANQAETVFVSDFNLNPCRSLKNSTEEICAGPLNFPLTVGQKTSYEKQVFNNRLGHATGGCVVKGLEKVVVPAGTFEAFKLECEEYWQRILEGSGNGSTKYTIWYSPQVKRLVKVHNEQTWNSKVQQKTISELVSYTVQ